MTIVATVKRIVAEACKGIPGATVIAPLPVWDNQHGSMGVQIKVPQDRGGQKCEVTASFVLTKEHLASEGMIKFKVRAAVEAIELDIQVQIRPVKSRETLPDDVFARRNPMVTYASD